MARSRSWPVWPGTTRRRRTRPSPRFCELVVREAGDERNFVKKAVNWALRNIGKRNLALNAAAQEVAARLKQETSRSARWIGSDALRELASEKTQARLRR